MALRWRRGAVLRPLVLVLLLLLSVAGFLGAARFWGFAAPPTHPRLARRRASWHRTAAGHLDDAGAVLPNVPPVTYALVRAACTTRRARALKRAANSMRAMRAAR